MLHFTREITKEEYEAAKADKNKMDELEKKHIGDQFWCGYGVYSTGLQEKDGKYLLWFDTGESCD